MHILNRHFEVGELPRWRQDKCRIEALTIQVIDVMPGLSWGSKRLTNAVLVPGKLCVLGQNVVMPTILHEDDGPSPLVNAAQKLRHQSRAFRSPGPQLDDDKRQQTAVNI